MRFRGKRYTTGHVTDPARVPHQDARVEAQLQQVLSRYAAIRRTEERLMAISAEQELTDQKTRDYAEDPVIIENLAEHSQRLHVERMELEAFISGTHRDIGKILEGIGDGALFLGVIR